MKVAYEVYLLTKTDILCAILAQLSEQKNHLSLIREIDRWDWEIENTLEGFAQLNIDVNLLVKAANRAKVREVGLDNHPIIKARARLLDAWNCAILSASSFYVILTDEVKREISEVEIEFDLYLKEG